MPPQPLAAELKTSSKEELLIPSSGAPRFSVQICLICISRETPLFDKEILTFPGLPRGSLSRGLFPFHLGVPWLFLIAHSCHAFGRQTVCSCSRTTCFPENRWKSCHSAYLGFYFLTFHLIVGVEYVKCAWMCDCLCPWLGEPCSQPAVPVVRTRKAEAGGAL